MSEHRTTLLQGTLDLLILKALAAGELHGLGVSRPQFRWVDRDGAVSEPLTEPAWYGGTNASWDLSPGGDQVAVRRLTAGGGGTLWLRDLVRGGEQPITQVGDSMSPVWSPDGGSVVFAAARTRPPDLFRRLLREGTETMLTGGPAAMFPQLGYPLDQGHPNR